MPKNTTQNSTQAPLILVPFKSPITLTSAWLFLTVVSGKKRANSDIGAKALCKEDE